MKNKKKSFFLKNKTFIIAEVGLAHDGSVGIAKSFIDKISYAGADAVKFQMHISEEESSKYEKFRKIFSTQDLTRQDYWKRTAFSFSQWQEIKKYCEKKKIIFLCSPFSLRSVEILSKLNILAWKIPSGEFNNILLLNKIIELSSRPLILSTGLSDMNEIKKVVDLLKKRKREFCLLQCTSEYPTKISRVGHNLIKKFKSTFGCKAGLSDHSGNINSLLAAVAYDAEIIETHVTFDKFFFGPDTSSSINFNELKMLCSFRDDFFLIKNNYLEKSYNSNQKKLRKIFNKSLIVNKDLNRGDKLKYENLDSRKPCKGIPAFEYKNYLGKKININIKAGNFLKKNFFK